MTVPVDYNSVSSSSKVAGLDQDRSTVKENDYASRRLGLSAEDLGHSRCFSTGRIPTNINPHLRLVYCQNEFETADMLYRRAG